MPRVIILHTASPGFRGIRRGTQHAERVDGGRVARPAPPTVSRS